MKKKEMQPDRLCTADVARLIEQAHIYTYQSACRLLYDKRLPIRCYQPAGKRSRLEFDLEDTLDYIKEHKK